MLWRYRAIATDGNALRAGELSGDSAAQVRASLRRLGLRPVDVRPVRDAWRPPVGGGVYRGWLRGRRTERKAELYDSLATMLDAGLTLGAALSAVAGSGSASFSRLVRTLELGLRDGASLSDAMERHPSWFDVAEMAMVRAGQAGGRLAEVLRTLSERHGRRGELSARLVGVLAYPCVVTAAGLGVVVFLSQRTLPQLTGVLERGGVAVPRLTMAVIDLGDFLVRWGPWTLVGGLLVVLSAVTLGRRVRAWRSRLSIPPPRILRRGVVGEAFCSLAELRTSGVRLVDALRVVAPTARGLGAGAFSAALLGSAQRIEAGESFSQTLDDTRWFSEEHRRLVLVGEASGELSEVLTKLGERERRAARRAVDRVAGIAEPVVILLLACMVGLVVAAAILPIARLQEVVR